MPTKNSSIAKILKDLHLGKFDHDEAVKLVARALDLITPFDLIPGIGSIIEAATDVIWLPAAEAIVTGFEKAREKALAKKAAKL